MANLSYERPSYYVEVGVAQRVGKPTHLIATFRTSTINLSKLNRCNFTKILARFLPKRTRKSSEPAGRLDRRLDGNELPVRPGGFQWPVRAA
jgi:hypothetical protein